MRLGLLFSVFIAMPLAVFAQSNSNKVQNFSFEAPGTPNECADKWVPAWNGNCSRDYLPASAGGWDGDYALKLFGSASGVAGFLQVIELNQTVYKPLRFDLQIKGENVQNLASDKYGAALYCRIYFMDNTTSWCPTTAITKNTGTFDWRHVGLSISDVPNSFNKLVKKVYFGCIIGAITGIAWCDDMHLTEYDTGIFQGAVTLMFDDGFIEQRTIAFPEIQSRGWCGTIAAVWNYLGNGDPEYINLAQLKELQVGCWEVVSHGMNHLNMTQVTPVVMEDEFYWSRRRFHENGIPVKNFALPFGAYNAYVLGVNEERGYFKSIRNSNEGYNGVGTFRHLVKVQKVEWNTTAQQVGVWLDEARAQKSWLILMFHKIRVNCLDQYCVNDNTFRLMLTAVQGSTLPVVTYDQGLFLVQAVN